MEISRLWWWREDAGNIVLSGRNAEAAAAVENKLKVLKLLYTQLPYDPGILLPGTHLKELLFSIMFKQASKNTKREQNKMIKIAVES